MDPSQVKRGQIEIPDSVSPDELIILFEYHAFGDPTVFLFFLFCFVLLGVIVIWIEMFFLKKKKTC